MTMNATKAGNVLHQTAAAGRCGRDLAKNLAHLNLTGADAIVSSHFTPETPRWTSSHHQAGQVRDIPAADHVHMARKHNVSGRDWQSRKRR